MVDYLNIEEKINEIKKINEISLENEFQPLTLEKDLDNLSKLQYNKDLEFYSFYNNIKNELKLKNKKISDGFNLSKSKNKESIFTIIKTTQNMKAKLQDDLKNITIVIKNKNKKLEEIKNEKIEINLKEYVSNLKKLNSDKKEIKENYNNAINFLIDTKDIKFEKIIKDNKEKILKIRDFEKIELEKINLEKINLKEIEQKSLIEIQEEEQSNILNFHKRNFEINKIIKKNQEEFNNYKNTYEALKKEDLNNILKIKKEDMAKFIFNKRSDDEINNLELEKFLSEYEIKEGKLKFFMNDLDKIFQIYEKYYLNKYKTKLDLISLIKRFILKDMDLSRTKARTICLKKTQIEDEEIKKLENDVSYKISLQKETTDYLIKENNRIFQRQSIDQKRIKNTNLLKNEISIEINRLNFILEKLIEEFNLLNNKKKNENTLENVSDEIKYKENELDIDLQSKINDIKKLNINSQYKSNKLIRKNVFLFQIDVFSNIKNINNIIYDNYFKILKSLIDKFYNNFNIALTLYKKLPYLSDSYLEYLNSSKNITDDLITNSSYILNRIYDYFSGYINKTIKDYLKTYSLDFLTSIKDYIKKILNKVEANKQNYIKDSKKIIIDINNFDVNIKNENITIDNLKKQIIKLVKLKNEQSKQTQIDYKALLNKKYDNLNIYKLRKLELIRKGHYIDILLEKNNDILTYLNNFIKDIDITLDKKTNKAFEKFDLILENIKKINFQLDNKFSKKIDNLKQIISDLIIKRIDKNKTDKLFKKSINIILYSKRLYNLYNYKIYNMINKINKIANLFTRNLYKIDNKNSDIIYSRFLHLSKIYKSSIYDNLKIIKELAKKKNTITLIRNINNFKNTNQSQIHEKKKIKDIISKNKQKEQEIIKDAVFSEKNSTQNDLDMKRKHQLDNYNNLYNLKNNMIYNKSEIVKNINDLNNEIINQNEINKNTIIKNYQNLKKDRKNLSNRLIKEQKNYENIFYNTINNINYKIKLNNENANLKIKAINDTIKKIIKERKKNR